MSYYELLWQLFSLLLSHIMSSIMSLYPLLFQNMGDSYVKQQTPTYTYVLIVKHRTGETKPSCWELGVSYFKKFVDTWHELRSRKCNISGHLTAPLHCIWFVQVVALFGSASGCVGGNRGCAVVELCLSYIFFCRKFSFWWNRIGADWTGVYLLFLWFLFNKVIKWL